MDTALLALHEKIKKEKEIGKVKKDVRMLKRKNEALTNRDQKIREDINRGELGPLSSYRLPLSVISNSPKKSISEEDIRRLKQTASIKQKLKGVAICYGVTSFREKTDDETKFMLDPYIAGKPYGPYDLRMKMSRLVVCVELQSPVTDYLFAVRLQPCSVTPSLTASL